MLDGAFPAGASSQLPSQPLLSFPLNIPPSQPTRLPSRSPIKALPLSQPSTALTQKRRPRGKPCESLDCTSGNTGSRGIGNQQCVEKLCKDCCSRRGFCGRPGHRRPFQQESDSNNSVGRTIGAAPPPWISSAAPSSTQQQPISLTASDATHRSQPPSASTVSAPKQIGREVTPQFFNGRENAHAQHQQRQSELAAVKRNQLALKSKLTISVINKVSYSVQV